MMLDWILNPFGIDLGAYVVLWLALLVIIPISVVMAIIKVIRDGRNE